MSEKLPYGEIHMSKIELRDALVKQIHENAALSNQVEALEQQLKTALPEKLNYLCMTFTCHPDYVKGYNQAIDDIANNLEGK